MLAVQEPSPNLDMTRLYKTYVSKIKLSCVHECTDGLPCHCFFHQGFLKSERVARMVQSGGCSASDFREVFKKNIERRVRSLPEIDGLSKETVLSSWITKYDAIYKGEEDQRRPQGRMPFSAVSELILSKEQLYEMFQQILGIKKFEHQLLYNALQVSAS